MAGRLSARPMELVEEAQNLHAEIRKQERLAEALHKNLKESALSKRDELLNLQEEHSRLKANITKLLTEAGGSADRIQQLQSRLEEVEARVRVLQQGVRTTEGAARSAEEEVEGLGSDVAQKEAEVRQRVETMRAAVDIYKTRLGLEIQKAPDGILLVFTQISRADPQQPFILGLNVKGGNQYHVLRCEPGLGTDLDNLLEALNAGGDFGTFVKRVRAGFKALAA